MSNSAIDSCLNLNLGKLQRILSSEWPELRDLYKRDWPKNIVSYYTLKSYIEWLEKNPKMDDVHIYTTDNNWRLHGTYILEDTNKIRYNVLFDTLTVGSETLVWNALQCLRNKLAYTLFGYSENVYAITEKYLHSLGLTDRAVGYCPTLLYHLPKEECLKTEIGNLMQGYFVGPLRLEHMGHIDKLWHYQYPSSDYFNERLIRYNNLALGIFTESNGDLCAWVFESEMGTIAMLQVDEKYQRRGFGKYLVALMTKKLAEEKDMDATATILETNLPSRRIFENLGFKVINNIYWYDKPAIIDG